MLFTPKKIDINMTGKEYIEYNKYLDEKIRKRKGKTFKDMKQKTYFISLGVLVFSLFLASTLMYHLGERNGTSLGFKEGKTYGERICLNRNYEHVTLKQAIAYNIKYNLNTYVAWFGLVVGLGWIFHGVGFSFVR